MGNKKIVMEIDTRDVPKVEQVIKNLDLNRRDQGYHKELYNSDPEVIDARGVLLKKNKHYREKQIAHLKEMKMNLLVSAGNIALEFKNPEHKLDISDTRNHAALARIGEIEFDRLTKTKG